MHSTSAIIRTWFSQSDTVLSKSSYDVDTSSVTTIQAQIDALLSKYDSEEEMTASDKSELTLLRQQLSQAEAGVNSMVSKDCLDSSRLVWLLCTSVVKAIPSCCCTCARLNAFSARVIWSSKSAIFLSYWVTLR